MNHIESSALRAIGAHHASLTSHGFYLSNIERLNYHYEFSVSRGKEKIKLQVYFGKKGVKTVLQGDQSSSLYRELYAKLNLDLFSDVLTKSDSENNMINEPLSYIGTDESGKGDYFGPLVVAGVVVDNTSKVLLRSMGVKDSKELSDSAIKKIATNIKRITGVKSNVISIHPKKYNEFHTKVGNVNRILGWAHAKVIENLLSEQNGAEVAISDKFGDEKYIVTSLQERGRNITLHQVTKAERFTAVAAASILARDRFNSWFNHEKAKLGFEIPKGASSNCESAAEKVMSKIGNHSLKDFVKLHFKNTLRLKTNN